MKIAHPTLQEKFSENGFCVIPNFLAQEQLAAIDTLYLRLGIDKLGTMYANVLYCDEETNKEIDKTLVAIYEPSLRQHFIDYRIAGGSFLIKGIGEQSMSSLHQDWNLVDESIYQSAFVWCPLIDVNENNGCLQLVPGSHRWFNSIRSINMPSVCIPFEDVKNVLKSVPVKRGDAVIFAHNAFHGSFPNTSDNIRPVAAVSILSDKAKGIHYYKRENVIDILDGEHFFNESVSKLLKNQPTTLTVIDHIPFDPSSLVTRSDFRNKLNKKKSLWSKLIGR